MSETNTEYKPKICIVKIDETQYWTDKGLVEACGGKIFAAYMYDENWRVHCAELTPSYELEFLEYQPGNYIEDSDECERVDTMLSDAQHDNPESVTYRHCRDIDRIRDVGEQGLDSPHMTENHRVELTGGDGWGSCEFDWDDNPTNEQRHKAAMDEAREWVQGNSV